MSAESAESSKYLKITIVGDGNTGKTCMLVVFNGDVFPTNHVPTVFDNITTKIVVDGIEHTVALWDTAGQEDYAKIRPLSYPNTKVFLLCFAVNSRASYENIKFIWLPELKKHCPDSKIVLIATKVDLRPSAQKGVDAGEKEGFVTTREGRRLKAEIGADRYMECSAMTGFGVQEVFAEAVRCALGNQGRGQRKFPSCLLL